MTSIQKLAPLVDALDVAKSHPAQNTSSHSAVMYKGGTVFSYGCGHRANADSKPSKLINFNRNKNSRASSGKLIKFEHAKRAQVERRNEGQKQGGGSGEDSQQHKRKKLAVAQPKVGTNNGSVDRLPTWIEHLETLPDGPLKTEALLDTCYEEFFDLRDRIIRCDPRDASVQQMRFANHIYSIVSTFGSFPYITGAQIKERLCKYSAAITKEGWQDAGAAQDTKTERPAADRLRSFHLLAYLRCLDLQRRTRPQSKTRSIGASTLKSLLEGRRGSGQDNTRDA